MCCVLCAVWYCMLTHVLWLSFVLVAFAAAKLTNNPQRAGAVNVVVPEGVNKMVISDGVTLQAGAVYYREPVGVQSGFTTSFTVEHVMYKIVKYLHSLQSLQLNSLLCAVRIHDVFYDGYIYMYDRFTL